MLILIYIKINFVFFAESNAPKRTKYYLAECTHRLKCINTCMQRNHNDAKLNKFFL